MPPGKASSFAKASAGHVVGLVGGPGRTRPTSRGVLGAAIPSRRFFAMCHHESWSSPPSVIAGSGSASEAANSNLQFVIALKARYFHSMPIGRRAYIPFGSLRWVNVCSWASSALSF
jgi:hypothetical protein